jgi:hypothetical protein
MPDTVITTDAVGEENPSTLPHGEESGGETTQALGEEGPYPTTDAVGEEDSGDPAYDRVQNPFGAY